MVKKIRKPLALFLALVMCLGMVNFTALANETAGHEHNKDGWTCTQAEPVKTLNCEEEEHTHTDECYTPGEPVLICEDESEEHEHDPEACYVPGEPVLNCEKTEHVHTDDCYTVTEGEWTCTAPVVEETPAEVTAFLSAVAAIRVPEEDLVLEENAELAEAFGEEVFYAAGLFEELTEEEQELEEVQIAMMELENMLTVLPDYGASTYALSNVVVRPDYNPGSCVPGVSKFGGSISKAVGETGFYQRRAVHDFYCPNCGWFFGRSDAKEYANFEVVGENLDVISNISYEVGNLQGYPCLQMNFTGAKAGTAKVTLRYDVNFHTRWNSGYAACPACGTGTSVLQYDDNWYHYEDTFYVTVESPKHEDQVWYVYVPTNGIENGSATIELNAILPADSIYYTVGSGWNTRYVYNNYNAFMPIRNVSLSDPNGVQGNYADISCQLTRPNTFTTNVYTGAKVTYNYGINLTVTGLDTPTPDGKPISVFLNYEWPYSCQLINENDFYMYYNMKWGNTVSGEIRIVVYEPETVTIKAGEANKYTHNYGDEMTGKSVEALTWGPYVRTLDEAKASANRPTLSTKDVVGLNYTIKAELTAGGNYDYYNVYGLESGIGKTTKVSTTYTYFGNYVGGGSNYLFIYPRTTYVDVVNYKVVADDVTTTPVTIMKEFDGLTEDQIPDNFQLKYTITGCSEHSTSGTLNKADATVTNANGTPSLVWNVDLPAVKHGDVTHTITFTESNAGVTGFTGPTMTGSTVTLESLTAENGAKPVIAVINKYEPDKNMYVLSYDGMGGTGCPATQYTNIGNTFSHTFNVAGAENPIKVPTHPQGYTFLGWSETDTNQTVAYAYNSETKTYTPATITLTKAAPSKTLYAVWKERPHVEPNPSLTKLEKVRVTDETQAPAGTPSDVEYGAVIFRSDDQKVKLLYKITVTGTEGAAYKVTDEGAEWVSGGTSHSKDGNALVITGTIAEGETTAVIYVTKEFGAADIKDNKLTNNAELVSNGTTENPTDGPSGDNGKDGDNSDASEKRNVTINFKTDDGETLKDSYNKDYDKGGEFDGINVNKPTNARKAAPRATAETIVIPWTIEKGGNTYVLDEVASAQALEDLKNLTTVTEDVVKDIIYSLDMVGGNDTTKPDGGSDGIPDKYQVKVTFKVVNGKWNDETNADVVKYVVKYAADGVTMDKNGTATLGNIIPAVGNKPDDGYEVGSWDTIPTATTTVTDETTYTYTYNKTVVIIPEYKVTVDPANGEDKTETTVKENGEFTVPAAPTAPEGKEFDGWKGSDGKDYKPGDKITVTGDLTLTAQWKDEVIPEPGKITVTWKSGYGENETLKTGEYDKGTATVPAADYPAAPSRSGYTFTGWSDPVADADGNLTITAQWTENTRPVTPDPDYTYTLNYNANGGVGAPASQSQINSRNFTVSAVEPTREGYTFAGWATTAGAETAAYQPGSQLRINNGFSLTLFAVWTPEEDVNETEPPLVETPDVTETPDEGEDLGDNDTPLTELPDETEPPVEPTETPDETEDLGEGETPKAEVPQTGDSIGLWIVLTLCSAAGLYCFFPKKKKGQREA